MAGREGQHIGTYRLLKYLGQGSFAEVYLGEHLHLGTQAAIKLFSTSVVEEDVAIFQQEARALAQLVHPNIVRLLDFGIESSNNMPYLVMDYIPGGTLRTLHPRGTRLPLPTVLAYVRQMAAALQYAHDQQCIHGAIKPEHLLVGRHGEVLLSDFGMSLLSQRAHSQNPRDMAGLLPYMAPEQIEAHPCPASDQYSLALVVYEWLGGTPPFNGPLSDGDTVRGVIPPPLRDSLPTLSPAIELVVMTALARKPEDRLGSVHAFAAALEQASRDIPAQSTSIPSVQGEISTSRGLSRRTVLLGAGGVIGVGLAGTSIWWLTRAPAPQPGKPQGTLYVRYLGHSNAVDAVAWSPDGQRIASGSLDKTAQVWDATNGGHVFTYRGHSSFVYALARSPDGKRITSASGDKTVQVWQA